MTNSVPPLAVVLLCILGGGAFVVVLAAFGRSLFGRAQPAETPFNQRTPEQDSYLRRVRETNQVAIWGIVRSQRKELRRQREREGSDIEIQSTRSQSNAGRQGTYQPSYHSGGHHNYHYHQGHAPVAYYEEEYHGHENANYGYEDPYQQQQQQQQQRPYTSGQSNLYQSKLGPTETWSEVGR